VQIGLHLSPKDKRRYYLYHYHQGRLHCCYYYQKIRSETNRFKHFTSLDELVKSVRNYNSNSSTYVTDVRIAFTGQPYKEFDGWKLEESKDFKVDGLQAAESDYEDIKEIIDDLNSNEEEIKESMIH
jgi:hypothetical protein